MWTWADQHKPEDYPSQQAFSEAQRAARRVYGQAYKAYQVKVPCFQVQTYKQAWEEGACVTAGEVAPTPKHHKK